MMMIKNHDGNRKRIRNEWQLHVKENVQMIMMDGSHDEMLTLVRV